MMTFQKNILGKFNQNDLYFPECDVFIKYKQIVI